MDTFDGVTEEFEVEFEGAGKRCINCWRMRGSRSARPGCLASASRLNTRWLCDQSCGNPICFGAVATCAHKPGTSEKKNAVHAANTPHRCLSITAASDCFGFTPL